VQAESFGAKHDGKVGRHKIRAPPLLAGETVRVIVGAEEVVLLARPARRHRAVLARQL